MRSPQTCLRHYHSQIQRWVEMKPPWCMTTCGLWPVPHVHHVFVFELSLKLLVVFLKDEDKFWVKEEDVVTVISEQVCLHNLQHLSTEIHWHVSGANCCLPVHRLHTDVMMWSTMLGWIKKQKQQVEKQEAEFVAKVYRGDIHVAVVARASKTRWVWCGFTEIHHHEILHCGFMVCL